VSFYALKDQGMAYLYELLKDTDAVAYHKVPFLRRCVGCKRKADAAHDADPSRPWEHHLNALPPCPFDTEDFDRGTISMTVQWLGRNFNFHAPIREGLKWGLDVDTLPVKSWTPEDDFRSLQRVVEDLTPVLNDVRTRSVA
jgi:hypothetical protein